MAVILLLVVVVPAALVVLLLSRLDPNALKPRLVAAIGSATGRTLALGGPITVQWALRPTLSVTQVTLSNLAGGSRPDMARADRIEAQISLLPLLSHRLEIVRLTLTGPNILFEQAGDQPNWVFHPQHASGPAGAAAPATRDTLRIDGVLVVNGMVTFRLPARTRVIGIRSLRFAQPRRSGPLSLDSVLVYSDFKPFTLKAHASPPGTTPDPGIATRWRTSLDVAAFDATASARGEMDLVGDYDLALDARIPKLEALNALLPEMHLPALHGVTLATWIGNGPVRGDLPVVGATTLHVGSADLGSVLPGLTLDGLDASLQTAGGVATLAATGHRAGQALALAGTVQVPMHPDAPARLPVALTLSLPPRAGAVPAAATSAAASKTGDGAVLTGRLGLRTLGFDGFDGSVSLHVAELARLRPLLFPLLPPLTGVSLQSTLSVPPDRSDVRLTGGTLQASQLESGFTLRYQPGPTPALQAMLHGHRLDLDALLPAGAVPPAGAAAPAGPLFPTTLLPWGRLRGLDATLDASLDTLRYGGRTWTALSLDGHLGGGALRIPRFGVTPPGGHAALTGSMTADASAAPAATSLALHGPAIPLALLADMAGLPGPTSGNLVLETSLQAHGGSPHALAASLSGPLSITLVGGSISDPALIRLAAPALGQLGVKVPPQGQTAIRCLGLVGRFDAGVGRFPTIALATGYLRLDGEGEVDLGRETLTLRLHPLAQLSGSRVSVPVLVDGGFRDIHSRLQASALDKVGLLIDAWFGGDHPHTCRAAGLLPRPG